MKFFLGTHQPHWMERLNIPLFISRRRLVSRKTMPKALAPWALDSGGFTELSLHGRWTVTPEQYVDDIRRFQECGKLEWCAIQDWMCEPQILEKTGFSVHRHQMLTVENLHRLEEFAPDIPFVPVLQGWEISDYWRHLNMYMQAGFDLQRYPVIGLGSVCRRQNTDDVESLIRELSAAGLRLHGFGFKVLGLRRVGHLLESADSMAWSFRARRSEPLDVCKEKGGHKNCANCSLYAFKWYLEILKRLRTHE